MHSSSRSPLLARCRAAHRPIEQVHVTQFCVAYFAMQSSATASSAVAKRRIRKKPAAQSASATVTEEDKTEKEADPTTESPEEEARAPIPPPTSQPSFKLAAPAVITFALLVPMVLEEAETREAMMRRGPSRTPAPSSAR
eukprot:4358382-Prymnesium_polylepis.2